MPNTQRIENPADRRALTVSELCDALNISTPTAYRRLSDGSIPCFRVGTAIRIPSSYVENLLSGVHG